jgi:hypothetical protein
LGDQESGASGRTLIMASFSVFGRLLERRSQRKGMEATRRVIANLTDADLADMGAKRYHAEQAGFVK